MTVSSKEDRACNWPMAVSSKNAMWRAMADGSEVCRSIDVCGDIHMARVCLVGPHSVQLYHITNTLHSS
jgi:hypothetical protein